MLYIGYTAHNKVAEFNGERRSKSYSLINLRLQYAPHYHYVKGLKLALGVDNVFDKKHANALNGINRVAGNSNLPIGTRVPDPGRNVYVTLNYTF